MTTLNDSSYRKFVTWPSTAWHCLGFISKIVLPTVQNSTDRISCRRFGISVEHINFCGILFGLSNVSTNTMMNKTTALLFYSLFFYFIILIFGHHLFLKNGDEAAKHIEYVSVVEFWISLFEISLLLASPPTFNHQEEFYVLLLLLARSNSVFLYQWSLFRGLIAKRIIYHKQNKQDRRRDIKYWQTSGGFGEDEHILSPTQPKQLLPKLTTARTLGLCNMCKAGTFSQNLTNRSTYVHVHTLKVKK